MSFPVSVNRESWQGQSQVCSWGFHFSAQPRWGQRLVVGVSRLTMAFQPLTASWGRNIEREGENTLAKGCSFFRTRSVKIIADAMEVVMPHLFNPMATYKSDVEAE